MGLNTAHLKKLHNSKKLTIFHFLVFTAPENIAGQSQQKLSVDMRAQKCKKQECTNHPSPFILRYSKFYTKRIIQIWGVELSTQISYVENYPEELSYKRNCPFQQHDGKCHQPKHRKLLALQSSKGAFKNGCLNFIQ